MKDKEKHFLLKANKQIMVTNTGLKKTTGGKNFNPKKLKRIQGIKIIEAFDQKRKNRI